MNLTYKLYLFITFSNYFSQKFFQRKEKEKRNWHILANVISDMQIFIILIILIFILNNEINDKTLYQFNLYQIISFHLNEQYQNFIA